MKQAKSPSEFIDLSFLSAEEEAAIRQVLLRNEDLNRLETGRIRKLRQSVPDLTQLKTLSGEWFEELRAERYGQRTDVTAVVRSSMRWKKTAAHKSNPFLNKIAEEKREGENETCTTPSHISADPRLIHPALSQETYRQYTDEDFMEDGPAGKSSSENIETSNGHKLIFNTDPKNSLTEEDSKSVNAQRPVLNGTEEEHKTTETQPKDFSGDRTTRNVQLSSEVQEQPEMKSERTAKKDATDAEPRRKISLPPALQKDHSFEENWVKIPLEPNQMKPVQDESKSVGHKLKEVNNESFVMGKKSDIQDQLFPNKKTVKVMDSHASDITVKKDLETSKSKEKIKPSSDQNPPRDTPLVLSYLSKEHLFMTDDTTLEQSDVTLHINAKHNKERQHEDKEKVKTKPSSDLKQPEYTRSGPNDALPKLSKDHLAMTDDRKLVHSEDVTWQETAFKTTGKGNKSLSEDAAGTEQAQGSSETKAVEGDRDTDQKAGSNILLSVLARAHKTRPPILQKISAVELKQEERDDKVPMIVIVPSESPDSKQKEENKNEALVLEASAEGFKKPSYTTDAWEDEGVDSDDDSSLSSYGSELSSRKGRSASTLSLTDSTKEDILNKVGNQTAVAYIHFYCMDPKPTQVKRFLLPTFIFFCVLLKFIQRTGSLLSVYSEAGDFGNVQVQGSVEFALMYSPVGELIIMIEQCQDLAFANTRKQRTDPYVKTYLYPDKTRRSKKKTSVKKRTVNPVYVESLRYKVKREELPEKTLNLSVWHNDSRGRNVFLGQVEISFKNWDWAHEALSWYNLQPKNSDNPETQESHGSLLVSLKYVSPEHTGGSKSSSGEIHVWLREAKELRRLRPQGVDSFVKCYVLPDTRKKSRQKTRVIKKTQDPVYNHTMVYDGFKAGEVTEACCELTVWDHNTLSNQFLGGLRLSLGTGQSYGKKVEWMDSMNEEVQIWKRMLANPNSWVDGDLPLRSSMTPRK